MADTAKPKQELTFFEEIASDLTPLTDDQRKALAEFGKEGMKQENQGLPTIASSIEMLHQGAAAFKFPDEPEDTQLKKSFTGVILHVQAQRAWWEVGLGEGKEKGKESGGNQMPDCHSNDLIIPEPSSAKKQSERCDNCQWNQFGSDRKNGRGKDCKEARRIFLMVEGKLNPHVLTVPATSLKSMKKYFLFLAERKIPRPQFALTKFSVQTVQNKDQIEYSELIMTLVKPLDERVIVMAMEAKKGLEEMLKNVAPMSKGEYAPEPGSNG